MGQPRQAARGREGRESWPDQEGLGFEHGQSDTWKIAVGWKADVARRPLWLELRVEPVEAVDLEPAGKEDQQPAETAGHRPGTEPLPALQRGPEEGEVQGQTVHVQPARGPNR